MNPVEIQSRDLTDVKPHSRAYDCIVNVILTHSDELSGCDREHLADALTAGKCDELGYIAVEFQSRDDERATTSLYVRLDTRLSGKTSRDFLVRDSVTGDDYYVYPPESFVVEFSWPSYGSDTRDKNRPRIELMVQTAELAARVEDQLRDLGETKLLACSRIDREAAEELREHKKTMAKLEAIVGRNCKHQRVGYSRSIDGEHGLVSDGQPWTVEGAYGRRYAVTFDGTHSLIITRTA